MGIVYEKRKGRINNKSNFFRFKGFCHFDEINRLSFPNRFQQRTDGRSQLATKPEERELARLHPQTGQRRTSQEVEPRPVLNHVESRYAFQDL